MGWAGGEGGGVLGEGDGPSGVACQKLAEGGGRRMLGLVCRV